MGEARRRGIFEQRRNSAMANGEYLENVNNAKKIVENTAQEGYCQICKFFYLDLTPSPNPNGFCRRNPPSLLASMTPRGPVIQGQFPPTAKSFWCGEYSPKLDL